MARFSVVALPFLALAVLGVLALAPACAVDDGSGTSADDTSASSSEDELRALTAPEILGALSYGETSAPVAYAKTPRYRAFSFTASAGDEVQVAIAALSGKAAQVWLTTSSFANVAASTTGQLPSAKLKAAGTYYIVFRSSDFAPASYAVTLSKVVVAPPAPTTWDVPPALVGPELPVELTCRRGSYAPWRVGGAVRIRPAGAPMGRIEIVDVEEIYSFPSAPAMVPSPCSEAPTGLRCGDGSPSFITPGKPVYFASYSIDDGKLSIVLRQTLLPSAPGQLDIVTCTGGSP
jgi:hypothetical protein